MTLVNIDAHSDMSMFDGELGIGNFISKMIDLGIVDRVVWIKDRRSMDFDDGLYTFKVGRKGKALVCSLAEPYYFFQGSYDKDVTGRQVTLDVVTDVTKLPDFGEKWVLSVDYDYFSCANPCQEDLIQMTAALGAPTISTLYTKGRMIKDWQEWQEFAGKLESMAPGIMTSVVRCMFPHYQESEDQITNRVLALAKAIKPKGCQAIYSISSLSTGFTDSQRHAFIDDRVSKWLGLLSQAC